MSSKNGGRRDAWHWSTPPHLTVIGSPLRYTDTLMIHFPWYMHTNWHALYLGHSFCLLHHTRIPVHTYVHHMWSVPKAWNWSAFRCTYISFSTESGSYRHDVICLRCAACPSSLAAYIAGLRHSINSINTTGIIIRNFIRYIRNFSHKTVLGTCQNVQLMQWSSN